MTLLGLAQLTLVTGLCFALLTSLATTILYPIMRPCLYRLEPTTQARVLLLILGAPLGMGALVILFAVMPSFLYILDIGVDHCHIHGSHHPHLCLLHPPMISGSVPTWALVIGFATVIGWHVALGTRNALQYKQFVGAISALSAHDSARDIYRVESELPLAFSIGIRRLRIFVSSALIARLSPQQLDVVLAHERAHGQRRDVLRQLVARAISTFHLPWLRQRLLADFDLALEQACDELAAIKVDDRLKVAETIITVEKQFRKLDKPIPFGAVAFIDSNVTDRVERLLDPPAPIILGAKLITPFAVALLTSALAFIGPLHHFIESLLGVLIW